MKRFTLSTLFFVALVVAWHYAVIIQVHRKAWSPVIAVPDPFTGGGSAMIPPPSSADSTVAYDIQMKPFAPHAGPKLFMIFTAPGWPV